MPSKRIKQSDIAKALTLSTQTISMALRGHKRISESTRKRVEAAAKEMGYSPDPTLAALANYRTKQARQQTKWERIALLHDWETEDAWLRHSHYKRLHTALKNETEQRGIQLEVYWVGAQGKNRTAVLHKLRARGIQSILLAPPSEGPNPSPIQVSKSQFNIVTFGPDSVYPDLHVIQFDYYENLRLTWQKLWQKGYRRIGLAYQASLGWRTNHAWLAAYLMEQQLAGIAPEGLPTKILSQDNDIQAIITWIKQHKIDAVILPNSGTISKLEAATVPVTAVSMHRVGNESGVDPNPEQAAFAALEILQFEMEHALMKKSEFNLRVHIPGRWID
jgi:DNA-binding LacI/PurR family transcriptional regulator